MISVHQPVVGKHMSVKPAVRKTHGAGKEEKQGKGRKEETGSKKCKITNKE